MKVICPTCGNKAEAGAACEVCGTVTGEKKTNPKQKGKPNA